MFDLVGQIIKSRMTIDLVLCGLVEFGRGLGSRCFDMMAFYYPDADAFAATGIDVSGIFDGHGGIGGMQTTHMFMFKTLLASDKDLP